MKIERERERERARKKKVTINNWIDIYII